jgi:hypothetical protein
MKGLPEFSCYGDYSSGNYGAHCLMFTDAAGNDYWFSYKTLVAFRGPSGRRVVLKNYWGPTTGKHLNCIDRGNKKDRVDQATFEKLFAQEFGAKLEAA